MPSVGLWSVTETGPRRLTSSAIDLERNLEDWIETDPDLLEAGLRIVGRQVYLEAGPLDLLALDTQGRWVVIELKRGALYRETLAQALDYAACIAALSQETLAEHVSSYLNRQGANRERGAAPPPVFAVGDADEATRDVRVYLVGAGIDPGLTRLVEYLSSVYRVPVSIVTFSVFELDDGRRVLMRELTEREVSPTPTNGGNGAAVEAICAQADAAGTGALFRAILTAATVHGLAARPFKRSIMYAPPSNRTRALFTVWARPTTPGQLDVWVGPDAIAEFYPALSTAEVAEALGDDWLELDQQGVAQFVAGLHRLWSRIKEGQGMEDEGD